MLKFFKSRWRAFVYCLLLFFSLAGNSQAQLKDGAILSGVIALGNGSSAPLPDGNWEFLGKSETIGGGNTQWKNIILRNTDKKSPIQILRISNTEIGHRWAATPCDTSKSANAFLQNTHGTLANSLINKCSISFVPFPSFKSWTENIATSNWWKDVYSITQKIQGLGNDNLFLIQLIIWKHNDRGIIVDALIRPSDKITPIQMRDAFKNNKDLFENDLLNEWAKIYIESLYSSFYDKKPKQIASLNLNIGIQPALTIASNTSLISNNISLQREQLINNLSADKKITDREEKERLAKEESVRLELLKLADIKKQDELNIAQEKIRAERILQAEKERLAKEESVSIELLKSAEIKKQDELRIAQEKIKIEFLAQAEKEKTDLLRLNRLRDEELQKLRQQLAMLESQKNKTDEKFETAPRKALVIGNDSYLNVTKLNNAREDARAIAENLKKVGYQVTLKLDLKEKEMKQVLRAFKAQVEGGDEVAIFYAGHGVQLGSTNYLLPVDIAGENEEQVKDESIQLQRILDDMNEKKVKFTLAMIDACRDNPFKTNGRSLGGRGLAPTTTATGQMVVFSAGSGQQALDKLGPKDNNKNSLFTRVFLKEMQKSGISIDRVVRNVRNEVVSLAKSVGHEQVPAIYDQVVGEFFFIR